MEKGKTFHIDDDDDGKDWVILIDFTKIRKGGIPVDELIEALRSIKED